MDSFGNFGIYNDGILVVMGAGILYAAVVIVAVVAVVVIFTFELKLKFNVFFSTS